MRKLLILVAFLALAPAAIADVYKWVDSNGSVHYGDTPPANARSRSVDLRFAGSAILRTTVLTLTGGRITDMQRMRQF
jgi:hypothetical protein